MPSKKTLGISLLYGVAGSSSPATAFGAAGVIYSLDKFPSLEFDEFDDSAIDQTSLVKFWQMTLMDGGHLSGKLKMTDAVYAAVLAIHDGTNRSWKITYAMLAGGSTAAKLVFDGALKKFEQIPGGNTNGKVTCEFDIHVNSLPVFTAGT